MSSDRSSMRDVARVAGVSLATVSYVLNDGPKPVAEATRERVLAAIRHTGYRAGGRGRSRTRSLTIGAIVPDASNTFFSQALAGAESILSEPGHVLLVASRDDDPARELQALEALARARVDGLIVTPCADVPVEVERLSSRGVPVVLMDREGGSTDLNRVVMDNYGSAFQATRLLIESGHRRIALVNGLQKVSTARERLRGYRDALDWAGLAVDERYVRLGPFSVEHGRQATLDLLSLPQRPEDIAVVGYGDVVWASLVTPTLTVVEQPAAELGETAARLLMASNGDSGRGQRLVLESHLILRESHRRLVLEGISSA